MSKKISVLIMLLTAITLCVSAADSAPYMIKEAVYLCDMGILNSYSPDAVVTKQTVINSLEMISGAYPGKYFKRSEYAKPATVAEAAAVLADFTGRGALVNENNAISVAVSAGITAAGKYGANEYVTMEAYAKMLYQTLNAKRMETEFRHGGNSYTEGSSTYLRDKMKIREISGVVTSCSITGLNLRNEKTRTGYIKIGDTLLYAPKFSVKNLGMNVSALYREGDYENELVSLYIPNNKNEVITVGTDQLVLNETNTKNVCESGKRKTNYKISDNAAFLYNGAAIEYVNDGDLRISEGNITLIDNNNDGEYDVVKITSYESIVISQIPKTCDKLIGKNKKTYDIDAAANRNEGIIYDEKGEVISASALKREDPVSIGFEKGTSKVIFIQKGTKANGSVSFIGSDSIVIGENEYETTPSFSGGFSLGTEIKAYINPEGKLFYAETSESSDRYGYVTSMSKDPASDIVKVKVFCDDNAFHVYELKDKVVFNGSPVSSKSLADKTNGILWNGETFLHQAVMFRVNLDDEISRIATAYDNNRFASYTKDKFSLDYSGELKFLTGDWQSLGGLYGLNSKTVVINVPNDIRDEDLFYTVNPSGWGSWTFNIELYDVDEEFYVGLALLRKPDYTVQQASFKGNKPIVVKKVMRAVDENGEEVYEITGWRNGAEYKIKTRTTETYATLMPDEVRNKMGLRLPTASDKSGAFPLSRLKPGSVIQPMLNNERLTGFTLFYDGETPVYYEYSTYTLAAAITDTECMVLSGRVYDLTGKGFIFTKTEPGGEVKTMRNIFAGSTTKFYLAENGEVRECTKNELSADDKVIMYFDYAALNTVVIQR